MPTLKILGLLANCRCVVTGGAGFIGSHLVERLLSSGAEVAVIDNFLFGNKIEHLEGEAKLAVYEGDVRDAALLRRVFSDRDIVFHLASYVGVEETQMYPVEMLDVGILGTINVLRLAAEGNVRRVVCASSSEVYGDSIVAMKEEGPLAPKSAYAVAKLLEEEYCKAYYHKYGLEYSCLRYFNVYGPRQDERFVVPRFVKNVLLNEPMIIIGDGNQTRDFTYIDDAVTMTLLAGVAGEARCRAINVGSGTRVSIRTVAEMVLETMGNADSPGFKQVDYDEKRPRDIEIFNRCADVSLSRQLLNYEPKVGLRSGIKCCVEWCTRNRC